ncbi:MAG TPA: CheR family methyltransferase [Ramlibacter sp.]|nr:CheR family methyltransferase [Ramlibacter sp.]
MTELTADHAEEALADLIDNVVPTHGYQKTPLVGLGGSAGSIAALQAFFHAMPPDSGQAFVVIIHLSPEHQSTLAEILQRCTTMPVSQVNGKVKVEANRVYVIPPGKLIKTLDASLILVDERPTPRGRRPMAVDYFFRTLADTHGPHAAGVVLSGADSDGAIGIKRIKERGGLTVAQDPQEAEHLSMPHAAIATGMVDWVLPVAEMGPQLSQYFELEKKLKLPPEEPSAQEDAAATPAAGDEAALREVIAFLRSRTGRDFAYYKRATVVRRIARRMQVNGVQDLPGYLTSLRTRPGEAGALLQDLLISVTNFFRDAHCFRALDAQLGELFRDKGPNGTVRVWVPACATGEEAYSLAILLSEKARELEASPLIQLFATDLDEQAIRTAREGSYPSTIESDLSEDLLRRYFIKQAHGYKVRRDIREMVLFAQHDLLKDSPFSRLDLISCRNLLIYLNRDAQQRVLEIFHFALLPRGKLFLGSSESVEDAGELFSATDKQHRIFMQRPSSRVGLPIAAGPSTIAQALEAQQQSLGIPAFASGAYQQAAVAGRVGKPPEGRGTSWGELHFRLLESLAPPSVLVNAEHDIVHLSASAGRFLHYSGGEPSKSLLRAVHPSLRIELRAALYQAGQTQSSAEVLVSPTELDGESRAVTIRVSPVVDLGAELFLVTFSARAMGATAQPDTVQAEPLEAQPAARHLERELERLKTHLRDTVEEYEASTEELKASNEELQAMNEEMRSATEELETGREELQSINEELTTVNQELKSKVDELSRSNSDIHNLMNATAIATVFLDRELRITRYTPAAVALFNLIATDLGRPLADLATRLDYPQLGNDARKVLDRLVPMEREVGLRDGKWFLSRLLPYRTMDDHIGGVVVSLIDITARKQAEEALRSSQERLRMVVENATEFAIFSTDLEGRITIWNSGAQRLLGYAEAEMLGQPLDTIFTDEDRAAGGAGSEMQTALAEGRASDDRLHQRKDGSRFWASGAMMLMRDAQGRAVGFVKILRDQTAAREAHQALEHSQADLLRALEETEAARRELQAADTAKDRFLAVLSHELRNPLASIDSAGALLLTQGVPASDRESAAQVVKRQAGAMKSLLDDLLDVSRLKLGRLELRREKVLLSDVVQAALESTRPLLEAVRHELKVDLPGYEIELDADPLRLCQVLANLLTNAIKYTPAGGKIILKARLEGEQMVVSVSDNGVGIEPAQIERMFDMFAQARSVANHGYGGLGIGLALVKSIVELHGGRVEAFSGGPGQGSEFHVLLPAQRAAARRPAAAEAPSAAATQSGTRGLILIADDNVDAGWGISQLLEIAGFETIVVNGGNEAVREARHHQPEVGIIDVGMPDLNGHEVARQIRQTEWGKRMVLIAATGWGQDSDERAAIAAGFDTHMTKPLDLRKLSAVVDDLLLRRRQKEAA